MRFSAASRARDDANGAATGGTADRRPLLELARGAKVPAVALVLDLPAELCAARDRERRERTVGRAVIDRQIENLRRGLPGLRAEGFFAIHVFASAVEADRAEIARASGGRQG